VCVAGFAYPPYRRVAHSPFRLLAPLLELLFSAIAETSGV
jgi:hypothetical protein